MRALHLAVPPDRRWRAAARGLAGLALLVASCARTGFQTPPLDGGNGFSDRPTQEGVLIDAPGRDGPVDAALGERPGPDAVAPDAIGPDTAVVDGGLSDAATADSAALDTGTADLTGLDTAVPDTTVPDATLPDTAAPDVAAPDTAVPDTAQPDTAQPDTAQPDTAQPDTAQPDTAPVDTWVCTSDPPWWNPGWALRRPLRIDETAVGQLEAGYSVVLRYNSSADVSGGLCLASGDDVRVVRWNGLAWTELHRHLRNVNAATTEIWFKTDNIISASDSSYWLYLGNPAAGAPPAAWADDMAGTSAVYLAADDFEDDTIGQRPDGWVGAGDYTVQSDSGSQVLRVVGTGSNLADYFFAGDYGWTDVALQGRLRIVDTGGTYYGLFARVESTTPFDTLWWGLYDNDSLQGYELEIADPQAEALNSGTLGPDVTLTPAAGTTWHTLETRVIARNARFFYDGVQKATHTLPPNSMQAGRVGLCAGYSVSRAYWDDIIVRALVDPEPTVSVAGPDEPGCP